jgi:diguanylate cyclase (GGDEF)-like protein
VILQPKKFKTHLPRLTIIYTAITLALIFILFSSISVFVLYQNTVRERSDQLATLSYILADHALQTIQSIKNDLNSFSKVVENSRLETNLDFNNFAKKKSQFEWIKNISQSNAIIDVVSLVGTDGQVVNFSRSYPAPPINLQDRDYFIYLSQHNDSNVFFSNPVKNKGNGEWVFYLAKRINNSKNEFIGIVLFGISIKVFSQLYEKIGNQMGEGTSLTLYKDNNILLTRYPLIEKNIGEINPRDVIQRSLESHLSRGVLIVNEPGFNADNSIYKRMVCFRKVEGLPFIVGSSVTHKAFLSEWRRGLFIILPLTLLILFGLFLMTKKLLRALAENNSIQYQVDHDSLTNLLNRGLFNDRLNHALNVRMRDASRLAILFLDVDHFKLINDQHGHFIGDQVLKEVAKRLLEVLRSSDSIARIGGDEFLILLPNVENKNYVIHIIEKICAKLKEPMTFNQVSLKLSVSIGVVIPALYSYDSDILIQAADDAMYAIKRKGGDGYYLSTVF